MDGRTLTNAGTATLAGTDLTIANGGVFDNQAAFEIQDDGDLHSSGTTPNTLRNSETLRKTAGTATSVLHVKLDNNGGSVDVQTGTLQVNESSLLGGTLTAADGATLLLGGNGHTLSGTIGGAPAGTVQLAGDVMVAPAGATLDLSDLLHDKHPRDLNLETLGLGVRRAIDPSAVDLLMADTELRKLP